MTGRQARTPADRNWWRSTVTRPSTEQPDRGWVDEWLCLSYLDYWTRRPGSMPLRPGPGTSLRLRAGLLDEIRISLVPVLLGGGVRLFAGLEDHQSDLEPARVVESDGITHLSYRVLK
jgi:hypothetical protein